MNPQDSNNTTTPSSDSPQPNSTSDQEVTVSLGEETPAMQNDNSTDTTTPSLSSDQPTANPTMQITPPQSVPPVASPEAQTPANITDSSYNTPVTGTVETPSDGMVQQPAPTVQPDPYMAAQDSAQSAPSAQPEQAPVPGTLPVAPPHSDKKTLVILAGVAVVLIVAIAVLLFM